MLFRSQSRFGKTEVRGRLTRCGLRRPIQADAGSHLGVQGDDRSDNVVDPVISAVRIEFALDFESESVESIYLTDRKGYDDSLRDRRTLPMMGMGKPRFPRVHPSDSLS